MVTNKRENMCALVHICVQMRRERRDERERIPLTLNTVAMLNEITSFSSPKEKKKKVQIIKKTPVIITKPVKLNAILWPSQHLRIAINILWMWRALIRCKPHTWAHTPPEGMSTRTYETPEAILPWRKPLGWYQPVCLSVCAEQFWNWRKGCS